MRLRGAWPPGPQAWDIQEPGTANRDTKKPKIFLGSEILIGIELSTNIKHTKKVLQMVDGKEIVSRGLYLYGELKTSEKKDHNGEPGFDLDTRITEVLRYLFTALKQRKILDEPCITNQWNYFHLDSKVGWISEYEPESKIFEAKPCDNQPQGDLLPQE